MREAHMLLLGLLAMNFVDAANAWSWPSLKGPTRHLKFTWNPPAPPLPSYPCPHTAVPTTLRSLWVDPNYSGTVAVGNATHPYKTLAAAWKTLPVAPKVLPVGGVTINIRPGFLAASSLYTVWGTADAPIVIQRDPAAAASAAPVVIGGEQLISNTSFLYFKDITFSAKSATGSYGTNTIRMWGSDYTYFLNVTVAGVYNQTYPGTGQAFKAYNCRGMYFEDSDVWGTAPGGWSLTYIAVQYGHICRSKVHHADWCLGITGGSAYIYVDSNEVYSCGQAALVSGLASGYVTPNQPWVTYDAFGVKVTNNIIHDVWGAGLSVFGGYSILLAHNTLYKVGSRSHTIEIMPCTHSCSLPAAQCAALNAQGGWYPLAGAPTFKAPSQDVVLLNNLIYNPANESAMWAHFSSMAPLNQSTVVGLPSTLPSPVTMHEGLVVRGNVFVNWHLDPKYPMSIGLDPCYGTGLPCDKPTLLGENLFNPPGLDIVFTDTQSLKLSEATKAALSIAPYKPSVAVPFASWSTPVETPSGELANEVPFDRNGVARQQGNILPGAYYDPAHTPAKFCSVGPNPSWPADSTSGWPAECGRVLVDSVCTAACGVNATGTDYTARCDDSNTWLFLGGGCTIKTCGSKPSASLAPNSAGWDSSCAGGLIGTTCRAACGVNASGPGYAARCTDNNTWTVVGGSCQGPPWVPATPPLPSYPCPRTQVSTQLTPRVVYVDPSYTGAVETGSATQPYKTFTTAWRTLPRNMLNAGVTINIRPGTALSGRLWMDNVWGTPDAPLIIQRDPAYGPSDPPSIIEVVDIFNCTYMYFKGITFKSTPGGDANVVHLASCSYMYILNCTIAGIYRTDWQGPSSRQALKVNQVKGLYVEDSKIYGSGPNGVGLDGVAVQYGHVCRSVIHHADWCMYLKGGSAYVIIDGNTVHKCGQAGLRVGQGTGFEFMTAPWTQYEAYGMKMTNNVIYDVWGAGLGVIGGYSVLAAHNSLYRVGSRSHTIEFNFGGRGCGRNETCTANVAQGGWGPALSTDPSINIPSKDVLFLNNVLVNPSNESAQWAHFSVSAPMNTTGKGYPWAMPNPITVTDSLVIRGNVIVNWHANPKTFMSLGLGPCTAGLACEQTTVLAENLINTPGLSLAFTDPEALVLTEDSKAALRTASYKAAVDVPFTTWATPPFATPLGQLDNTVPVDKSGVPRGSSDLPGAWV